METNRLLSGQVDGENDEHLIGVHCLIGAFTARFVAKAEQVKRVLPTRAIRPPSSFSFLGRHCISF